MASIKPVQTSSGAALLRRLHLLKAAADNPAYRDIAVRMNRLVTKSPDADVARHRLPSPTVDDLIAMSSTRVNDLFRKGLLPKHWGQIRCLIYALECHDAVVERELSALWQSHRDERNSTGTVYTTNNGAERITERIPVGERPAGDDMVVPRGRPTARARHLREAGQAIMRECGAGAWAHDVRKLVDIARELHVEGGCGPLFAVFLDRTITDLRYLCEDWPKAFQVLNLLMDAPDDMLEAASTDRAELQVDLSLVCLAARQFDEARTRAGHISVLDLPEHRWESSEKAQEMCERLDRPWLCGAVRFKQISPAFVGPGVGVPLEEAVELHMIDSPALFVCWEARIRLKRAAHRRLERDGAIHSLVMDLNLCLLLKAVPESWDEFEAVRRSLLRALHRSADGRSKVYALWHAAVFMLGLPPDARIHELRTMRDSQHEHQAVQLSLETWSDLVMELTKCADFDAAEAERTGLMAAIRRSERAYRRLAGNLDATRADGGAMDVDIDDVAN